MDIDQISISVNPLLYLIVIVMLIVIVKHVIPLIKARTSEQQFLNIKGYVSIAVYAVEQMIGAGKGDQKLIEATKMVVEYIKEMGYTVSDEIVRELIEAAVYTMNLAKGVINK